MGLPTKYDVACLDEANIRNDSFLARVFLTWVYGVVGKGRSGLLHRDKLRMPQAQAAEVATEKFDRFWKEELSRTDGKKPSLLRALRRAFGWEFYLAGLWKCLWSVFVLLGAFYFVRSLVQFTTKTTKQRNMYNTSTIPNGGVGWILSACFFVDSVLVGTALQRMTDYSVRVGIKIRAAVMASVYRKTFRLQSLHNEEAGNPVSLVSTDCYKLYEGVQHIHNIWTAPGETAAIIALLLGLTNGIYGLPAVGVVLFVLPMQYFLGLQIAKFKSRNVHVSDARVLRMHEVLLAIKLVKFYVWEKSFAEQVSKIRGEELKLMIWIAAVKTMNLCMVFAVPPLIALVIYVTYQWGGDNRIDSVFAFTILSLFNTLRFPLVVLPKALRGTSEAIASLARLESFLQLPEKEENARSQNVEVKLRDAILYYGSSKDEFKLQIPQFEAKPGEVVAIVGRVGCGKSSLFQAVLSNMILEQGELGVGGSIAYVPQTPWVQNLSLRENILFGLPYDESKYKAVIHACALELDLQILPNGDQTVAGERGINLSGGQRQRVCLARAAYHDCDVVLLDNPLSAVDQHTARHIFDYCIRGLLKDKAVLWITHQLELLPQCHKISIMVDNKSVYFGPYDPDSLNQHLPVDHLLFATVETGESAAAPAEKPAGDSKDGELDRKSKEAAGSQKRQSFQRSSAANVQPVDSIAASMNDIAGKGQLAPLHPGDKLPEVVEDPLIESPEEIAVQFSGVPKRFTAGGATWVYLKAGGVLLGFISLCIFGFTQTIRIMSDLWVRYWASDYYDFYEDNGTSKANFQYFYGYLGWVLGFVCLLLTRDTVYSVWSIRAATRLHNRMFYRVLRAPFLFFLRTPVGDVLSAFAKDQDTLDETLADTLHMTTIYLMILLTSIAIVTVSINYYAALAGALFLAFFMMQFLYLPAATVLKHWVGESASAVYVHVDESLQGMDVVRAFDAVNYFIQENVRRINMNHLCLFNTEECHLWLAFWCDLFGAGLVLATCLFSVGMRNELDSSAVGLALSNTIQVLVFFTWTVRGVADSVSMWDSVERMATFSDNVPVESEMEASGMKRKRSVLSADSKAGAVGLELAEVRVGESGKVADNWPTRGDLKFQRVCLRYFPGAPLALKYVTFHIQDKEKVGVVGRTGSGKTTLLMALFRMFGLAHGSILVDELDISAVALADVRKRIAIIPQEPVMFKGTVRSNLDPFGESPDSEMWLALELVHMKDAIQDLPGGLDAAVAEAGSNFSLGQKQLICMARCVVKKTRILVLDEATAAMDLQTDSLIQKTVRKVFKERTTITIAHRLDTIIFSDKILGMSSGQMKEFDVPTTLLHNPRSMFSKLVDDTGSQASAQLRRMAAEGPKDDDDDDQGHVEPKSNGQPAAKPENGQHKDNGSSTGDDEVQQE